MSWSAEALRAEFPALAAPVDGKRLVYLDSACTALKPRRVAEAVSSFYLGSAGCGGKRSTHLASQAAEELLESARRETAEFIGAESPNEVVFCSGTTEAANLLARAFPFREGKDEVVLTEAEHNAVMLPFADLAERGRIRLRLCPVGASGPDLGALERLVSDRTALVAMTRSSNVLGGAFPAAEAARIAHRRGAYLFLDEAQYLSSHREDVRAVNADFAAFSAHKLGGPFGIGVLYGKEHLLNRLGRYKSGGGSVKDVTIEDGRPRARYLDAPRGLEAGVPDFGGLAGMREALRMVSSWPAAAVRAHVAGLVRRLLAGLSRVDSVRVLGEPAFLEQGSVVSFAGTSGAFSAPDFNLYLNHELEDRVVAVRSGEHCAHLLHRSLGVGASVRVSFFAYNTAQDVDDFLAALGAYAREACA